MFDALLVIAVDRTDGIVKPSTGCGETEMGEEVIILGEVFGRR